MKKAFTLAEMLITMTIIGTISALMYSNLARVKPDEKATLYKKAYFSVQEVVASLANDPNTYPDPDLMFRFAPSGTDYRTRFCQLVARQLNTVGSVNCVAYGNNHPTDALADRNGPDFKVSNGTAFYGFNQTFKDGDAVAAGAIKLVEDHIIICVDVNGDKGPNVGCEGSDNRHQDRFRIRIEADGKVSTAAGNPDAASVAERGWAKENGILENSGVNTVKTAPMPSESGHSGSSSSGSSSSS